MNPILKENCHMFYKDVLNEFFLPFRFFGFCTDDQLLPDGCFLW